MPADNQIQIILNHLANLKPCRHCGTRLRFGDWECPHCGIDLEEDLRRWAEQMLNELQAGT